MMNEIVYPTIMSGKKLLYVHGFGSSGSSGTVARIRELLPSATVIAPDLPLHPAEAMDLLNNVCQTEKPDLIIGTSMGGMYTEMLYGYDRILVNPAFQMGETMIKHGRLGINTYLNPRKDGVQELYVTKPLVEEYKEISKKCFSQITTDEMTRVYGLFGDNDDVVDTRELFSTHYSNDISFHGGHRLNDKTLIHSVVPVIRWIDDKQEGRERPLVYIDIETLRNKHGEQMPSAMKAFRLLLENYNVFVVADAPMGYQDYYKQVAEWVLDIVNVPAWQHLVFTSHKDILYGDYLIDTTDNVNESDFLGTQIVLGGDTFKTWDDIIEFFSRLGGQ